MCIMPKYPLLVLLLALFLFSCAAPAADLSATAVPSEVVSATMPVPVIPTQTAPLKLIPKHNDLIFVEFFAVT